MTSWKKVCGGWVEDNTVKDTSKEEQIALSEWWGNKSCMPWFTFLNQLPKEIQQIVMEFLSPILNIFIKEVIEKENIFRLYSTGTEIHSGPVWRWRPEIRKYCDEKGFWYCDYNKTYGGGGWAHDGNVLKYTRGSEVPLWWIRHKQDKSPFYRFPNKFIKCADKNCREDGVSVQGYCPNHTCKSVEDIIWGVGPSHEDLDCYSKSSKFMYTHNVKVNLASKSPVECDEVSFRKNLCCMALSKHGCDCGNMLSFRNHFNNIASFKNVGFGPGVRRIQDVGFGQDVHQIQGRFWKNLSPWYKHQVQDPKKECHECILRNKAIYGDKADMYETRCVFTRKKLPNEIRVEIFSEENEKKVFIYTNRLPKLKNKPKSRKQLRKIRNFNKYSDNVGRNNKNTRNLQSQYKLSSR